jgi:hypothetical protein
VCARAKCISNSCVLSQLHHKAVIDFYSNLENLVIPPGVRDDRLCHRSNLSLVSARPGLRLVDPTPRRVRYDEILQFTLGDPNKVLSSGFMQS